MKNCIANFSEREGEVGILENGREFPLGPSFLGQVSCQELFKAPHCWTTGNLTSIEYCLELPALV